MATIIEFTDWLEDFKQRFPAVREYVKRNDVAGHLLDTWHQVLVAFTPDTLAGVTLGIITGEFEPIENTQLGQFAHEIRQRARQVIERTRKQASQDWQQTESRFSPTRELARSNSAWMLRCALAVDKLQGVTTAQGVKVYAQPHSVRPQRGSYDAAIIMADEHTPAEEFECLATFAREGLTWDQIQAEACKIQTEPFPVHQVKESDP